MVVAAAAAAVEEEEEVDKELELVSFHSGLF